MTVLHGLEELREKHSNLVVTIGNFDGVHLGHQALFQKTIERAKAVGGVSLAMTFEPHPMRVLRPAVNLPLITPLEKKLELIKRHGIDVVLCVRFDQDFASLSADDFVDKLLVGRLAIRELVVGYDFAFGKKGLGDLELLGQKAEAHGFRLSVVGPVMLEGRPVSSTRVRQEVNAGNMTEATKLLGRYYRMSGKVVTGHGRGGRLLGFPTANLKYVDELIPAAGVYAVFTTLADGSLKQGVTNIGYNPTFQDGVLSVETFLLDYQGDIYDQHMILHFVERLRGEKRFSGPEELMAQIGRDVEEGRRILAETKKPA